MNQLKKFFDPYWRTALVLLFGCTFSMSLIFIGSETHPLQVLLLGTVGLALVDAFFVHWYDYRANILRMFIPMFALGLGIMLPYRFWETLWAAMLPTAVIPLIYIILELLSRKSLRREKS